jgi:hypothetical protein
MAPGLPDVIFVYKKSQIGYILGALVWKNLVYLLAVCNILWPFRIVYGRLVYFIAIWYIPLPPTPTPVLVYCTKKNLATLLKVHGSNAVDAEKIWAKFRYSFGHNLVCKNIFENVTSRKHPHRAFAAGSRRKMIITRVKFVLSACSVL